MKKMILILALFSAIVQAQPAFPPSVETSLSRSEAFIGQTVYLTFSIQTEEKATLKPLRKVYGLQLDYQGENVSTQMTTTILNGRRQSQTVYHYRFTYAVTPLAAGNYLIPQTSVSVGSAELPTTVVKLVAKEAERNDKYRLFLKTDCGKQAYSGQTVELSVAMEISANIDQLVIKIPLPKNCQLLPPDEDEKESEAGNVKINDSYYPFVRESTTKDKAVFVARVRFRVALPDSKTVTEFHFAQATASFRAVASTRESVDVFGRPVQDHRYESVVIPAEEGSLMLLPLPELVPADFSGIVGRPQLSADADLKEAYVGDPITYRLTVSGVSGEILDPFPLHENADFLSRFRIPEHHSPPLKENGRLVFVYTIRPLSAAVTEIPAFRCTVFNPETSRYETVVADALPLTVRPSPNATNSQIEEFFPSAHDPQKVSLDHVIDQIPAVEQGKKLLKKELRFPFRPLFWILYAAAFVLTLVPLTAATVKVCFSRRKTTAKQQHREMRRAVSAVRKSKSPDKAARLLLLTQQFAEAVADIPVLSEETSHLKRLLFSGQPFDEAEIELILKHFEEALR